MKKLLLLIVFFVNTCYSQIQPLNYWRCDDVNPAGKIKDFKNNFDLTFGTPSPNIQNNGLVSKYVLLSDSNKLLTASSSAIAISGSFTIEMLWYPGRNFGSTQFWSLGNKANCKLNMTQSGPNQIPCFQFTVANQLLQIDLDKNYRGNIKYYLNKWTHLVWTYDNTTGVMKMYVDGQCPIANAPNANPFTKTITAGSFPTGNAQLTFNSGTTYRKLFGGMDEICVYASSISSSQIASNYADALLGHHYQFTTTTPEPNQNIDGSYLATEYAPGSILLDDNNYTEGVTIEAIDQLYSYPLARFRTGNKLLKNFNSAQINYLGSYKQPGISNTVAATKSLDINIELVKWNYYFMVNANIGTKSTSYNDLTTDVGKYVNYANAHPEIQTSAFVLWPQLVPSAAGYSSTGGPYAESAVPLSDTRCPPNYYLRNSSGQFINLQGVVDGRKYLSPICPLDLIKLDGLTGRFFLNRLTNAMTRPLNYLGENNEIIRLINSSVLSLDPLVLAAKNASGLDWNTFTGNYKSVLHRIYRDSMIKGMPGSMYYMVYQVGGYDPIFPGYDRVRTIQLPINGMYYSNTDYYPRRPKNWRNGVSADRSWQAIIEDRNNCLPKGDKLSGPYVAAGWDNNEPTNIRPGQWLGYLKCLAATGAEFYQTGYFNLPKSPATNFDPPNPPPSYPKNYIWQLVTPSYAQAVTSYAEDVLKQGDLMVGDIPASVDPPKSTDGYMFNCGDPSVLTVIRKKGSKYWITTSIQKYSNKQHALEVPKNITIFLDGDSTKFETRLQGSEYIYDKTNPSAPIFYQLDKWHQASHYSYWVKDTLNYEAEVNDSMLTKTRLVTDRKGLTGGNFTDYTTYVEFKAGGQVNYTVPIRSQKVYYMWIKAKKASGTGTLQVKIDGKDYLTKNISKNVFRWYRIDLGQKEAGNWDVKIRARVGDIDIDSFDITTNQFYHTIGGSN